MPEKIEKLRVREILEELLSKIDSLEDSNIYAEVFKSIFILLGNFSLRLQELEKLLPEPPEQTSGKTPEQGTGAE